MISIDQRTVADPARYEACGECALASLTGVAPLDIVEWIEETYGGERSVSSGTDARELRGWCDAHHVVTGTFDRSIPGLVAITTEFDGQTYAPIVGGHIGHWLAWDGECFMNPWGGGFHSYNLDPRVVIDSFSVEPEILMQDIQNLAGAAIYNRYGLLQLTVPGNTAPPEPTDWTGFSYWTGKLATAISGGQLSDVTSVLQTMDNVWRQDHQARPGGTP